MLYDQRQTSRTLASLGLTAWEIGWWLAKTLVEHQLAERAKQTQGWGHWCECGRRLESKGLGHRRMLTFVGWVAWQRRVGRWPQRCAGSHCAPFAARLGLTADQQTSMALVRLGCFLAVFLPVVLAVPLWGQGCGVRRRDDSVWQWVQPFGRQARPQRDQEREQLAKGLEPLPAPWDPVLAAFPLVLAADGVSVPLRPVPGTARGNLRWRAVQLAGRARRQQVATRTGQRLTRVQPRRRVAGLGGLAALPRRLQLEALRQRLTTAPQGVWVRDGAPGLWRLFAPSLAPVAMGLLAFYPATQHRWQAAEALLLPARPSKRANDCAINCGTVMAGRWSEHWGTSCRITPPPQRPHRPCSACNRISAPTGPTATIAHAKS